MSTQVFILILVVVLAASVATVALMTVAGTLPAAIALATLGGAALMRLPAPKPKKKP